MATRLPTASRNAAADAVVDLVDGGAGAGKLRIYSGAQPASANSAPVGTLLAEFTLSDPAFGGAATGVADIDVTPALSVAASAAGTAQSFRIVDSNDATVVDGAVTATGGGGELTLDNTSIASGQTVNVTALSYTVPATT